MQREGQSTDHADAQEDTELKTISCPNCNETVPTTLYCLKCGFPLFNLQGKQGEENPGSTVTNDFFDVDPLKKIQDDLPSNPVEIEPSTPDPQERGRMGPEIEHIDEMDESDEKGHLEEQEQEEIVMAEYQPLEGQDLDLSRPEEMPEAGNDLNPGDEPIADAFVHAPRREEHESHEEQGVVELLGSNDLDPEFEADPRVADLTKELINSITLQLWSIDLLLEGGIDDGHFGGKFKSYKDRFERCMASRNEMLEEARDLEAFEKKVKEAKVQLGELEVRSALGDLHEGEYEAMAPALKWMMVNYEGQIAERNARISMLMDLSRLMPAEKIADLKDKVMMTREAIEGSEVSASVSSETVSEIKASLDEILSFLDDR
jgi:hypothetical protein